MAAFGEVEAQLNTEQYAQFHDVARESFADLLIGTGYNLALQFRPYDPTNLYRGVRPLIRELGIERDVSEMGDGVSNLAVLALFRAYAEVLRGTGILMIEEPETWLHPQAQRALSSTIDRMAESGIQLVITTHSPAFIQPERFDEVVVVRRDSEGDHPTVTKQVSAAELVEVRRERWPAIDFSEDGLRERLRQAFHQEQAEGFFARGVILVEGDSDREVIRSLATACGVELDKLGVSVVAAGGKTGLDQCFDLFTSFDIPVYVVFDADSSGIDDTRYNRVITSLHGGPEIDNPATTVTEKWTSFGPNLESALDLAINTVVPGLAEILRDEASNALGSSSKVLRDRYVARAVVSRLDPADLQPFSDLIQRIRLWADALN